MLRYDANSPAVVTYSIDAKGVICAFFRCELRYGSGFFRSAGDAAAILPAQWFSGSQPRSAFTKALLS